MRRLIVGSAVAVLLAAAVVFAAPGAATAATDRFRPATRNAVADSYIVVLTAAAAPAAASHRARLLARYGGTVTNVYSAALDGFAARMPAAAARALSRDPAVAYVEQDSIGWLSDIQSGPGNWGLDRIDQQALPLNGHFSYPATGSGVHVYLIDSGIRVTHSQFGGRATNDVDFVGDGQNGNDCHGHGTHVAGIIGGSSYGVAKNVRLHGLRIANCSGSPSATRMVAAFDWVVANGQRPGVINASFGSRNTDSVNQAAQRAMAAGFTVVAATGNTDDDACEYAPAEVANLAVSSVDANDTRDESANWGTCVDVFAPGVDIRSADIASDAASRVRSGTSMAAPHVTGAVAQLLETRSLTPAQAATAIVNQSITGRVVDPGRGSPNRMLFTGNDGFVSLAGNFGGNGGTDIIEFTRGATGDVNVAISNGSSSFGTATRWHDNFAFGSEVPMVGDFNADGRDDIVVFTRGTAADVFVAINNGSSFQGTGAKWNDFFAPGAAIPAVGDVNADGRDDIVSFTRGVGGSVFVSLSTGTSFGIRQVWHQGFAFGAEVPMLGDVNADGRADLIGFTRGGNADVFVSTSTGTGFSAQVVIWHEFFAANAETPAVGDFNCDGRDDIVTFTRGGPVYVALSTGFSFSGTGALWHDFFGIGSELVGVGNFNGSDLCDDIITFTRGSSLDVYVALSNGSSFNASGLWHGSFGPSPRPIGPVSNW